VSAGLVPADEGSDRLTVDRLALIERWVENFGLDGEWELRIAQQEAEHVAGLVEAAVSAERQLLGRDLGALTRVGRMYLDALDADPDNEYLTLAEAWMVTEVRDAVERREEW
jgi:hypothetical protein